MSQVAAALMRTAERDFPHALHEGRGVGTGETRDLWISRIKGWASAKELREINKLLNRLSAILHRPRSDDHDQLISLAWVLAPLTDQPLRR